MRESDYPQRVLGVLLGDAIERVGNAMGAAMPAGRIIPMQLMGWHEKRALVMVGSAKPTPVANLRDTPLAEAAATFLLKPSELYIIEGGGA